MQRIFAALLLVVLTAGATFALTKAETEVLAAPPGRPAFCTEETFLRIFPATNRLGSIRDYNARVAEQVGMRDYHLRGTSEDWQSDSDAVATIIQFVSDRLQDCK